MVGSKCPPDGVRGITDRVLLGLVQQGGCLSVGVSCASGFSVTVSLQSQEARQSVSVS